MVGRRGERAAERGVPGSNPGGGGEISDDVKGEIEERSDWMSRGGWNEGEFCKKPICYLMSKMYNFYNHLFIFKNPL